MAEQAVEPARLIFMIMCSIDISINYYIIKYSKSKMVKPFRISLSTLVFFSLAAILTISGCSSPTASNGGGDNTPVILKGNGMPGNSTWTIMVYLDGDNNLESSALDDMNEMELVKLDNEGVNVIVLIDRCDDYTTADGDWTGTRLYEIKADNDLNAIKSTRLADSTYLNLTDTGDNEELNMGNPDTVIDFIDYCRDNYSADHYALVFWNHGGGWREKIIKKGGGFSFTPRYLGSSKEKIPGEPINKAVCWDETSSNDCLYMSEVESAVAGKGIDLIGFDACLMGMVEVAYELSGHTDYMVASEETEPACGWAYQYFLYNLIMQADNTPANFGKAIVDSYIDHTPYNGITLSVIDMAYVDSLVTAISTFATALSSADTDEVCSGRYATQYFFVPHYIDLYHFAGNLPGITGSGELRTAIDNTVPYHRQKDFPDSHGLSIYYPITDSVDSEYGQYSSAIAFPGASTWDEFLVDYYTDATYYTIDTFPNAGSYNADTYLVLFTENGSYIYEDDDSGGSSLYSRIMLPLASGDTYYILNIEIWNDPGYYSILVNDVGGGSSDGNPAENSYEPNNTMNAATLLPYNTVQDHYLADNDQDWFEVTIP